MKITKNKIINRILFEDNHLIIINKYGGIKVQPDSNNSPSHSSSHSSSSSIYTLIKEYIKITKNKQGNIYLGLVHRIDRLTSGVLILSKTSKSSSRLFNLFTNKIIIKKYIALINGNIFKNGKCEDYISDSTNPVKIISSNEYLLNNNNDNQYKIAKLSYEPIYHFTFRNNPCTVLEIQLETGRKHQIRCQLNKLGYSILGDNKYCQQPSYNSFGFIGLHSHEMTFPHPTKLNQVSSFPTIFSTIFY